VVKIVYKRDKTKKHSGELYFINTQNYKYHLDFSQAFLNVRDNGSIFNRNYVGTGEIRDYNLASLVLWSKKENIFLLELWNGDTLSAEYISELVKRVKVDLQIPNAKILFHPLGFSQELEVEDNKFGIDIIKTVDLFKNETYIPLNTGIAYGYVRFIEKDEEVCLDNTSIAVYTDIPNDIGLIGGVITEEFQTPLSHINVKSINRGTINFSLKDAKKLLAPYLGKPIKLEVKGNEYKINVLDEKQAEIQIKNFWANRKPSIDFNPLTDINSEYDNQFVDLQKAFRSFPTKREHKKLIQLVGAKATNIAVLGKLSDKKHDPLLKYYVPKGFGVPFNFYNQFMDHKQKGLDKENLDREASLNELIEEILLKNEILDTTKEKSFCAVKPILEDIRNLIKSAEVPVKMLNIFKAHLIENKKSPIHQEKNAKIRLRSSTNSEDMEGFSGAGLYNSTGVWLYGKIDGKRSSKKPHSWEKIHKSLKKKIPYIYSSVWNDRAFEEREWYSMNGKKHLDIKVGIALHRGFPGTDLDEVPGEFANGVAITTDIHDNTVEQKVYINSQHFDLAVTNPPTDEDLIEKGIDPEALYSTEEVLVTTFLADWELDQKPMSWLKWSYGVLSRSSVKDGEPVLKDDPKGEKKEDGLEVRKLAKNFKILNKDFARVYGKATSQFVLDIEWKLIGPKRELWIKQARPFNVGTGHNDINGLIDDAGRTSMRAPKRIIENVSNGPRPPKRP
jgi:pyruvate,water dikinase